MDELSVLKHIFKDELEFHSANDRIVYKICLDEKYLEFRCDEEYPKSIPELVSNVERNILNDVREESKQFISTPMIFDMIRLTVKKLEESGLGNKNEKVTISYDTDDGDKITEEEFLEWKMRNVRTKKSVVGETGREIFLKRSKTRKEMLEDED